MKAPKSIRRFVEIFSALPGIGPRQAIRLAFYFIKQGRAFQNETARIISGLKDIGICKQCFYIHENKSGPASPDGSQGGPASPDGSQGGPASPDGSQGGLCEICEDKSRDRSVIAMVEKETDMMSIENTKKFHGRYLILGDVQRSGILETEQKLRINSLKSWIKKELSGRAKEIIIAINPTLEGDVITAIIIGELKPLAEKITRLGRGIPTGGEIEFADEETLGSAIERRG